MAQGEVQTVEDRGIYAGFAAAVESVVARDARFAPQAYFFLFEALMYTRKSLRRPACGPKGHVSGGELLAGFRDYALREFGPMAATVLEEWGLKCCEDVGSMVFNLVAQGQFSTTDDDKPEDFSGGFDFCEAFRAPFRPKPRAAGHS